MAKGFMHKWQNRGEEDEGELEKYTVYTDFFADITLKDEENKEETKQLNMNMKFDEGNGENEYPTLRAKNSTIFNDYFGCGGSDNKGGKKNEKKKGKETDRDREKEKEKDRERDKDRDREKEKNRKSENEKGDDDSIEGDSTSFPVNKNYVYTLFEGDLVQNRHKVKLKKPGFYCIFVENHNNSKWDALYLWLLKVQVEINYKLLIKRNKNLEEIEKRNAQVDSSDSADYDHIDQKKRERKKKKKERTDQNKSEEKIKNEIDEACKFNLEENDMGFKNRKTKKGKRFMNKNPYYKEKYDDDDDDDDDDYDDDDYDDDNDDGDDDENMPDYLKNGLVVKNTNYYDNLVLKNKYASVLFDSDACSGETYSSSFDNENQIRVPCNKKRYVYLYNEEADTILDIMATTYMALGMSVTCKYGLLYCGKYNHIPRDPNIPFRRQVSILALDGGGVLSISTLQILSRLELEIRKELGSDDVNLIDCFDMISGTSAGGLICLGLLKEMQVQDMVKIWPSTIKEIFKGHRNIISGLLFGGYDINRVKDVLMENMGNKFISSHKKVYCFVVTTDVKHKPFQLFLLRNYSHKFKPHSGEPHPGVNKVPLWVAGWATSAAPTYLKGPSAEDIKKMGIKINPEVHLIDGALKANNPSVIALEECARLHKKCVSTFVKEDLDTLVSVGTGQFTTKLTQGEDNEKPATTLDIIMNSAHLLTRANQIHREILQMLAEKEDTYFRLNTPNIGDIELDSHDTKDFDLIVKATHEYLFDEKYYDIKRLATKLANNYIRSKYM